MAHLYHATVAWRLPPGADFALYVTPGKSPSWMATGKGMNLESFKALTAALIIVGK